MAAGWAQLQLDSMAGREGSLLGQKQANSCPCQSVTACGGGGSGNKSRSPRVPASPYGSLQPSLQVMTEGLWLFYPREIFIH